MRPVTIFSAQTSPRLKYTLDWLFNDVLQINYRLVHDEATVSDLPFFISYGRHFPGALSIPENGLLWQKGIVPHKIARGSWKQIPALYYQDAGYALPFDMFSAVFFLLSRYEEYLVYSPDKHNRYPHTESWLYKEACLERPLIDEWVFELHQLLLQKHDPELFLSSFQFQPTYDIDIAFSYRYKGWKRTAGALAKDFMKGEFARIGERLLVMNNKKRDPFDSFGWLSRLHGQLDLKPVYFVLAALNTSRYDKNIPPAHKEMQRLIRDFNSEGCVGMHPSYYSDVKTVFRSEKKTLENITGHPIHQSRQHYLRLQIPDTYYRLIDEDITDDFTMGYGGALGFRAGTGRTFNWYDLNNETPTSLQVHPFCFMDTTARFEMQLNVEEAFAKLAQMKSILEHCQSRLTTVFHNFSLGSDIAWQGWPQQYESFLKELAAPAATSL